MSAAAPAVTGLPTAPAVSPARGAYIHIPFCLVHCPYCDFNAHAGMDDVKAPYVAALIAEIQAAADGGPIDTIAFGGGTPTELAPAELARILRAVRSSFAVAAEAEIGLEANPESADRACFDALLGAGFTRVSVGVQSLTPSLLAWLGRAHSPERAVGALRDAVAAGFEHVNGDLMFGTPGETADDWRASLEGVLETGVDHISTYALTVEEKTPLSTWVARGRVAAPDDDEQADRYQLAAEVIRSAGLVRYEISNWARPGCWSRHNVGYWTGAGYLGFGAGAHSLATGAHSLATGAHSLATGAHSLATGRRWWNVRSPRTYVARSPAVEEGSEALGLEERAAEAAMLGLRLAGGIDRAAFARVWGVDPGRRWPTELSAAEALGLVSVTPERVALTDEGFFLWGHVARSLLAANPSLDEKK